MSDLGERVTKAATAPLGGAIQKRQNIANELKPITALVEEMLCQKVSQGYTEAQL